jgi:Raf kinase inhibitor-like YbhB/YbcL family protein
VKGVFKNFPGRESGATLLRNLWLVSGITAALLAVTGCQEEAAQEKHLMHLTLASKAFEDGGKIPARNTCDGFGYSPPLEWTLGPPDTAAFAITCTDPSTSGGEFNHWVIYNIPATVTRLPEGVTPTLNAPPGSTVLANDFEHLGYGGPCPPPGGAHHYVFRVYALDGPVNLTNGASAAVINNLLRAHSLAFGQLEGLYTRK